MTQTMRLIPAGTAHFLWLRFLLLLPVGMAISTLKLTGNLRAFLSPARRREVAGYYRQLATIAQEAGFEGRLTRESPDRLARGYFVQRAIMGIAPNIVTVAPKAYLKKFSGNLQGQNPFLKAVSEGKGLLTVATHFGGLGVNTALLRRNGCPTTILRDGQFKRYEDTPHGRAFFLGAEAIFLEREDPESTTRALLKCTTALKAGRVVGYTADASHGSSAEEGVIFGRTIPVRTALARLTIRTKSPVTFAFAYFADGCVRDCYTVPRILKNTDELDAFLLEFFDAWQGLMLEVPEAISWSGSDKKLIGVL